MAVKLADGYSLELTGGGKDWRRAKDERWEVAVYGPTGAERHVGSRRIDGAACFVFRCPDGKYRACLTLACG